MKTCFCKIVTLACLGAPLAGFAQSATLLNTFTNPAPRSVEYFGASVAAMGSDRVLIGAPSSDGNHEVAGVAHLFSTDGTLLTTFTNPIPQTTDEFGRGIAALGNDRVIISAPTDSTGAELAGVAYLFSTNGTLLTTFANPAPNFDEGFGSSIAAVGSDCVLVGGPRKYDPNIALYTGVAYLFSTNGILLTTFTNPAPVTSDTYFGSAVAALGSDRVIIGSLAAAYLYTVNGTLLTTFSPPLSAGGWFGSPVAAFGSDRVLIGDPGAAVRDSYVGKVYMFNTNGTLLTTFNNPAAAPFARFGASVAAVGTGQVLINAYGGGASYLFSTNGTLLSTFPGSAPPGGAPFFQNLVTALDGDQILLGSTAEKAYLFSLEPPHIGVTRLAGGVGVIISRPKTADDFVLEEILALAPAPAISVWSRVPTAIYQTNATSIFITLPVLTGNKFYRLRKP